MKWLLRVIGSIFGSFVTLVAISVVTIIWLMFSGGDVEGQRQGYFGSIFVEVIDKEQSSQLGFGVLNFLPLLITFFGIIIFVLAVLFVYDRLLIRKEYLLDLDLD